MGFWDYLFHNQTHSRDRLHRQEARWRSRRSDPWEANTWLYNQTSHFAGPGALGRSGHYHQYYRPHYANSFEEEGQGRYDRDLLNYRGERVGRRGVYPDSFGAYRGGWR